MVQFERIQTNGGMCDLLPRWGTANDAQNDNSFNESFCG